MKRRSAEVNSTFIITEESESEGSVEPRYELTFLIPRSGPVSDPDPLELVGSDIHCTCTLLTRYAVGTAGRGKKNTTVISEGCHDLCKLKGPCRRCLPKSWCCAVFVLLHSAATCRLNRLLCVCVPLVADEESYSTSIVFFPPVPNHSILYVPMVIALVG